MLKAIQLSALVVVLGLLPPCAQAQLAPREAGALFEGADEIAVYTPDSPKKALDKITQILRGLGFAMGGITANVDSTRFLIRGWDAPLAQHRDKLIASEAYVAPYGPQTRILLKGQWARRRGFKQQRKVPMAPTTYTGPATNINKAAFNQLASAAQDYPNGRISYRAEWLSEYR